MEKDNGGFFFAITAINIAFFMKKYFHLADFLLPGKDALDYCNRRALKSFCRVLVDKEDAY
jgi:regulator of sigma D